MTTAKTVAAILDLLADNTAGKIGPVDVQEILQVATGVHGGMLRQYFSTTFVNVTASWLQIDAAFDYAAPIGGGMGVDLVNGDIVVPTAGVYEVAACASYWHEEGSFRTTEFGIGIDGVVGSLRGLDNAPGDGASPSGNTWCSSMRLRGWLRCASANAKIGLYVRELSGSTNPTVWLKGDGMLQFMAVRVGD